MTDKIDYFTGAPDTWALPITQPGSFSRTHWAQHEYVTCMQCGFSFAAHNDGTTTQWHYQLPTPKGWTYLTLIDPGHAGAKTVENHPRNPFVPKK